MLLFVICCQLLLIFFWFCRFLFFAGVAVRTRFYSFSLRYAGTRSMVFQWQNNENLLTLAISIQTAPVLHRSRFCLINWIAIFFNWICQFKYQPSPIGSWCPSTGRLSVQQLSMPVRSRYSSPVIIAPILCLNKFFNDFWVFAVFTIFMNDYWYVCGQLTVGVLPDDCECVPGCLLVCLWWEFCIILWIMSMFPL